MVPLILGNPQKAPLDFHEPYIEPRMGDASLVITHLKVFLTKAFEVNSRLRTLLNHLATQVNDGCT